MMLNLELEQIKKTYIVLKSWINADKITYTSLKPWINTDKCLVQSWNTEIEQRWFAQRCIFGGPKAALYEALR